MKTVNDTVEQLSHARRRPSRSAVAGAVLLALAHAGGAHAAASAAHALPMKKAARTTRVDKPSGPNPMLAFLPAGAAPDYDGWRSWMALQSQRKRATLPLADPTRLIAVGESEPNGSQLTANAVGGFGTGSGDDRDANLTGSLSAALGTTVIGPFAEDDGSIPSASGTGLVSGAAVKTSQVLGDGPHGSGGSGNGDFDFFAIAGVAVGDTITVDIDAVVQGSLLDSFVVVWDAAGQVVAANDDSSTFDSFVSYTATAAGTYYVSIGAYLSPAPADPFDSSSGSGFASEGPYDVTIGLNSEDADFFSFTLEPGDVIAGSVLGGATELQLYDPSAVQRIGSTQDAGFIMPGPFPTGGNAAFAYVVETAGNYAVRVSNGSGAYTLELRAFRPHLEGQAAGTVQTLFIDFNGATLDPAIFGNPPGTATLSPLSSFLAGWGLTLADEGAVIDAVLAAVEESLSSDMRVLGANGDFDLSGTPGDFDIVILNSRDHADPVGNPNVSRVIVGGTMSELGIPTIGIAQSIDVGNFAPAETGVVLLDLLSGSAFDPDSLNQFGLAGGATIIDLVGVGVGNIVAHEAGHFFANFHTDNQSPAHNIMDQGGNLANTVGVGPDLTFGTADDADVDFGPDVYTPQEGFSGLEDTLNAVAFDLSTSEIATVCGDGVINGAGEQCDDGNLAGGDCCSPTCTMPTCAASGFGKAMLLSKELMSGHERLVAKFLRGPALAQIDFGNPVGGGTAYHLCIWRDGPTLVADYLVDRAGDACGVNPCWKSLGAAPPSGKGYGFKDLLAASDGVQLLSLKSGAAGRSKALVKGGGSNLPPIAAALQTATSVTMQLHGDNAPVCLQATLTNISRQDPTSFKAK